MRDQFRRADTFLTELLQNGWRAGASRIGVDFEPDTTRPTITDDGSGIESPDILFLIGQSGFKEIADPARENPFGIGFAAALFAASLIRIRTRGWSADFATADLLALQPVPIGAGGFAGTRIELTLHPERVRALFGVKLLDAEQIIPLMETLVAGFPVPVWANGREIERPGPFGDGYSRWRGKGGRRTCVVRCVPRPVSGSLRHRAGPGSGGTSSRLRERAGESGTTQWRSSVC